MGNYHQKRVKVNYHYFVVMENGKIPSMVGSGDCLISDAQSTGHVASNVIVALRSSSKKCQRNGKMKVECDRFRIIYTATSAEDEYIPFMTYLSMKSLIKLFYLLSPV